jgi:hypothetical protein
MAEAGNYGLGIALSGEPRQALRIAEMQAQNDVAQGAAAQKAAALKARQEAADLNKISTQDFKIDPSKYHKKLAPLVSSDAKDTFQKIVDLSKTGSPNWQTSMYPLLMDYRERLKTYQDQSKVFFDYEAQDPIKFNIDPEFRKRLNANPGDLTDITEYVNATRGLKGVDVGENGFVVFNPAPKGDFNKEWGTYLSTKGAFNQTTGKPRSIGDGLLGIDKMFSLDPVAAQAFLDDKRKDPAILQQLIWEADPATIPADVDTRNPAKLAEYGQKLFDEKAAILKKAANYSENDIRNAPEDSKATIPSKYVGNGRGGFNYQTQQGIWSASYDEPQGKYWISVQMPQAKGEKMGQKELEFTRTNETTGKQEVVKGTLQGFIYDPSKKTFKTIISRKQGGDGFNFIMPDANGAFPSQPATSYETLDIGWDPKIRDMLQAEFGNNNPLDVAADLLKRNYGVDVGIVNEEYVPIYDKAVKTQKPGAAGAPSQTVTRGQSKALKAKADSLAKNDSNYPF